MKLYLLAAAFALALFSSAHAAGESGSLSGSTSAYCQARARLDPDALELVSGHLCWSLERNVLAEERWLRGRPVKIVDGTGLSMPDTRANQARWPQPTSQQPAPAGSTHRADAGRHRPRSGASRGARRARAETAGSRRW